MLAWALTLYSTSLAPARYKYIKQTVTIDGLDTPGFREAMRSMAAIHGLFDRCFPEGKLEGLPQTGEQEETSTRFSISNRYFTSKDEASPGAKHIPFGKLVDPNGTLEGMAKDGYWHTEDNKVDYFKRKGNEEKYR